MLSIHIKTFSEAERQRVILAALDALELIPEQPIPSTDDELVIRPDRKRLLLLPIKYPDMKKLWDEQVDNFWTDKEIDLSKDRLDYETKLNSDERRLIRKTLSFFAIADGIVMENLAERFQKIVQIAEARQFYAAQVFNESVHSMTYALMLNELIRDRVELENLLLETQDHSSISKKADWALKWIDNKRPGTWFAHSLIAFAAVEGIFFSGSFGAIKHFMNKGLLPGVGQANDWIRRDEGLHQRFACRLFQYINQKPLQVEVHAIIAEAVAIECEYWDDALPRGILGLSAPLMKQHTCCVADNLCLMLGYEPLFYYESPLDFMKTFSGEDKDNFFEKLPGQYSNASVLNSDGFGEFTTEAEF
jgi:ribonucleoside-diphosphate reductase subunit M2